MEPAELDTLIAEKLEGAAQHYQWLTAHTIASRLDVDLGVVRGSLRRLVAAGAARKRKDWNWSLQKYEMRYSGLSSEFRIK